MLFRAALASLSIIDDLLYVVGGICIVVGVNMIYTPAAWITAGALLIAGGVFVARYVPEEKPEEITDVLA